MRIITISDFRKRIAQEFDAITDNAEDLVVTRAGAEPMVVISKAEYDAWKETAYLLSGRGGEILRQRIKDMREGKGDIHDLVEPDADADAVA